MKPTRESVLSQIKARPTRFQEFAPSRSPNSPVRKAARAAVNELLAEGLIEQLYLDGLPHLVMAGWKPDAGYFQLRIDERCKRTPDGCLEWIGARNHHGSPVMRFEKNTPLTVRSWLWEQRRGRKPDPNHDRIYMSCMNDDCVEPTHMVMRPANWKHRGKTRTLASIVRMSIASQRKITRDDARAIRASTERSAVLAERYGVTRETINQVRRGATHREFAGVFAGLGAMQ